MTHLFLNNLKFGKPLDLYVSFLSVDQTFRSMIPGSIKCSIKNNWLMPKSCLKTTTKKLAVLDQEDEEEEKTKHCWALCWFSVGGESDIIWFFLM